MQYYTIEGKYYIQETFENQEEANIDQEPSSVDNNIEKIFKNSQEEIKNTLNQHKDDLLKSISFNDGNLGVGVSEPSHKFTIKSNSYEDNFNIIATDKSKGAGVTLTNDLNNSSYLIMGGSESDIGQGNLGFGSIKNGEYKTNMELSEIGNLGLGTKPIYKLHLSNGENQLVKLGLGKSSEFGNPIISYIPGNIDQINLGYDVGVNSNALNNNSKIISINRNNKVGINTDIPKSELHIKQGNNQDSILGISGSKNSGIILDNSGNHNLSKVDSGVLIMDKNNLILSNGSKNDNLILMTGGKDQFTINKLGQITVKNKLNFNVKEYRVNSNSWKNGDVYTWTHNLGYIPSLVKAFFYFERDVGGIFVKDSMYEITNSNDTSDWPNQRGIFMTYNKEKVFIRIAPYGPMLLNLTGQANNYYDIKPGDGSIIIKIYDTN